jgi:hypothetical protein
MSYSLSTTHGTPVAIERSVWTGPKVIVNGQKIKAKRHKWFPAQFSYPMPDGGTLLLQPNGLDPVPKVWMDGAAVQLARPLDTVEKVLCYLPLASIVASCGGGWLIFLLSFIAVTANFSIMRSERPRNQRLLLAGLISGLVIAVTLALIAFIFSLALMNELG